MGSHREREQKSEDARRNRRIRGKRQRCDPRWLQLVPINIQKTEQLLASDDAHRRFLGLVFLSMISESSSEEIVELFKKFQGYQFDAAS